MFPSLENISRGFARWDGGQVNQHEKLGSGQRPIFSLDEVAEASSRLISAIIPQNTPQNHIF
jgi:hypothetical protein